MTGFRRRASVAEVSSWIERNIRPLGQEHVELAGACGRVLAEEIRSPTAMPPFDRAAMNGYEMRVEESFGAWVYSPAVFRRVGRSYPGLPCLVVVGPAEAVEVATGSPIPAAADAVIPVESTRVEGARVIVTEGIPLGRNVGRLGEDIAEGAVVVRAGRAIRAQDLGVLTSVGAQGAGRATSPRA
jgi:molybdopterin molybdotransferase